MLLIVVTCHDLSLPFYPVPRLDGVHLSICRSFLFHCDFSPTLMSPLFSVRDGMSLLLIVGDVVLVLSFINVVKDDDVYVMTICESVARVDTHGI